jgi:hypothetical protein
VNRGLRGPARLAERGEGPDDGMPRRNALRGGLGAIAAVAMVWLVPRSAIAASNKVSKVAVQYTDTGNVAGKDCDDCSQFLPGKSIKDPGTCKVSVRQSRLENATVVRDDGVHQAIRWTPWNTPRGAGGGATMLN